MQVFKFGGASVKDAEGVINLATILRSKAPDRLVVVVSAMGKTTNLLERLLIHFFNGKDEAADVLEQARTYHIAIAQELFTDPQHPVMRAMDRLFDKLDAIIRKGPVDNFDYTYDQLVSVGELLSTTIISAYLQDQGIANTWVDARQFIATDDVYREANVDWEKTRQQIRAGIPPLLEQGIVITQGFIGGAPDGATTTLGREGSDYSAAIFAACLDAEQVCIWKDVPGVLNADPKWFDETELIPELSYLDAIELTYYGATVIHPKTIKPLQNQGINLQVRSFLDHDARGTLIGNPSNTLPPVPSFIFKVDQVLLSIMPRDFSFIVEDNLSHIFGLFHSHRVKINMMHNSAVSFAVSVDNVGDRLEPLLTALEGQFKVKVQYGLELITIRYYDQQTIDRVLVGKQVIMELKDRLTCQLIVASADTVQNPA